MKKNIIDLNYNEFSDYFYTNIVPLLKPIEEKRKTTWVRFLCNPGILLIVCVDILVFTLSSDADDYFGCTIWSLGMLAFMYFSKAIGKDDFRNIYEKIFKQFGLNYCCSEKDFQDTVNQIVNLWEVSDIYMFPDISTYNFILTILYCLNPQRVDDIISGEYHDLPFKLVDCSFFYKKSKKKIWLVSRFVFGNKNK